MKESGLAPSYQNVLDRIYRATLDHMVAYRLEIGALILAEFFENDPALFHDRSRFKPARFKDFLAACGDRLDDIGMGERTLRACVQAHLVVADLDEEDRRLLTFSHLTALAAVKDRSHRRLLGSAAVQERWSVAQLSAAAARMEAGQWIDQDPQQPGLQPEPIKPSKPRPPRPTTSRAITSPKLQAREVKKAQAELKRTGKALNTVAAGIRALKAGGWEDREKANALRKLLDEVKRQLEEIGSGMG
jgi:hypothetical protein